MKTNLTKTDLLPAGLSSRKLLKRLFECDSPEEVVRTIPAQSLFLALRREGLESIAEVVEIASLEQCRLFLDFDSWKKDKFQEDNFWEWLELLDVKHDFGLLKKVARAADQKLFVLLISRYVDVQQFDNPTEEQPGEHWYTPDKGYTWIHLHTEDEHKDFLLGRLLAFIFETDADWFYQLLAAPNVSTPTELEESAYQEKTKRLCAEGIPDDERAFEINAPLAESRVLALLKQNAKAPIVGDVIIISPLIYDSSTVQPLAGVLREVAAQHDIEPELTLIMNAAIVRWLDELHDTDAVQLLSTKVKGAMNIGLESALKLTSLSGVELFEILGAQNLYRFGLEQLNGIRAAAKRVEQLQLRSLEESNQSTSVLAGALEPFPEMPTFLQPDGSLVSDEHGVMPGGYKAIETMAEVTVLKDIFSKLLAETPAS